MARSVSTCTGPLCGAAADPTSTTFVIPDRAVNILVDRRPPVAARSHFQVRTPFAVSASVGRVAMSSSVVSKEMNHTRNAIRCASTIDVGHSSRGSSTPAPAKNVRRSSEKCPPDRRRLSMSVSTPTVDGVRERPCSIRGLTKGRDCPTLFRRCPLMQSWRPGRRRA